MSIDSFTQQNNRSIGMAFGGGAVFGYAHVGICQALDEYNIRLQAIAGTSIGSLVGTLYAFGIHWKEMAELGREIGWLSVTGVSISKLGLLSNKKLGSLLRDTLGDVAIEDAPIPLAIMTTDISTGERVVLRRGNLAQAVMASTCIPGIFNPVEIDGRLLVDGGVAENVPLSPLAAMGANFFMSADLTSHFRVKKPNNVAELLVNAFHTMHTSVARVQDEKVDIAIKPNLTPFTIFEAKQRTKLIKVGYQAAKDAIEQSTLVDPRAGEDT